MTQQTIEFRIDELVLESLPFDQRQRVAAALEHELSRLLTAGGSDALSGDRHLALHEVEVSPHWSAEAIGHHAAQSAYQQITAARPPDTNSTSRIS